MFDQPFCLDLAIPALSAGAHRAARLRQSQHPKPSGSLTHLEALAATLACQQDRIEPHIYQPKIAIFAADHGIARQLIPAYSPPTTAQMVANFIGGDAAINVLAQQFNAELEVVNLGTTAAVPGSGEMGTDNALHYLHTAVIAPATADFSTAPAMTEAQCWQAICEGARAAERADQQSTLFIGGEMGAGNRYSATALASLLLNRPYRRLCDGGDSINESTAEHSITCIEQALQRVYKQHKMAQLSRRELALIALQEVGGFEIAALCGAYIRAAQLGRSILLDGMVSSAAALLAYYMVPAVKHYYLASHLSAQTAHREILAELGLNALITWDLDLGEGSGATLCIGLLESACQLHNHMSSLAQAELTTQPKTGAGG